MPHETIWIQEFSFPVDFSPTDRIFVPEMKDRWKKQEAIDPNQSSASLATDTRSTLYRILAISRLEPKVHNGNRQDRESKGPCAASRADPVRLHVPIPPDHPRRSSG